jgi:hypothetical protein
MTKLILIIAALLAVTSAAQAGSTGCTGKVVVGSEWTLVEDAMGGDEPGTPAPDAQICRFKTSSDLGKRILAKCPAGTMCELSLSIANKPSDHRVSYEGGRDIYTIIKWPVQGVERLNETLPSRRHSTACADQRGPGRLSTEVRDLLLLAKHLFVAARTCDIREIGNHLNAHSSSGSTHKATNTASFSGIRFLVALTFVWGLLLCAKHLFVCPCRRGQG